MTDEPSNAASVLATITFEAWNHLHLVGDVELEELVRAADANSVPGFAAEDRRRLHREFGALGVRDMVARQSAYGELSGGDFTWTVVETMAVHGDRLALQRRRIEFANGSEIEWLAVMLSTPDMLNQRLVLFDPEDHEAALELLDELQAANPEPAAPGAVDRQLQRRRGLGEELRRRASERNAGSE